MNPIADRCSLALCAGLMLAGPCAQPIAAGEAVALPKLRAVPFTDVVIADSFWAPRRATNRLASIPANLAMLEKSGNLRNFELAGAGATAGGTGAVSPDPPAVPSGGAAGSSWKP